MVVFESARGRQSRSTAEQTILPAVRTLLSDGFPDAQVVGVIAPTGWALIQAWQACVEEGREPIILHFPTPKLSRVYWRNEIAFAIQSAGVGLLLCWDAACVPPDCPVPVVLLHRLQAAEAFEEDMLLPRGGGIIQMSSGTTGHRKGIRFGFDDVRRHVEAFNARLRLTSDDVVVSWLPLYHDMGFVAAYLMPRLLGCKLVMMDPVDWVRRPEMLWEAIEAHGGTVCYMPNFGFEVMAGRPNPLPTMRRWISCSEPTRRATMERFAQAVGAAPGTLANCWGMAENIFAVTLSDRITARTFEGVEVVSCGPPIPGVEVKSVEGEIHVRSAYSLQGYIGFPIALDEDGFYASGDLGEVVDGEVYLLGRKHDMLNVAGRKTLASDVDYEVGCEVPESAGRIATFASFDADLGTDVPIILVEHPRFWRMERDLELRRRIVARVGIESARVNFVPPRFITKTSSGKVNRKATAENWRKRLAARSAGLSPGPARAKARAELAELFPWLDHARAVGEQIDSLGFVSLSLILERYGLANGFSPEMNLESRLADVGHEEGALRPVLRIASLTDANIFSRYIGGALDVVRDNAGLAVQFKHLCAPALPVLLQDMIFADYFLPRDERGEEPYADLLGVLQDLRSANLIVIDDATSIFWPYRANMVYPQLSHDFQADEEADTLVVRWARYSEGHHDLACRLVRMEAEQLAQTNSLIEDLGEYLGVPVVRVAYGRSHPDITSDWEVQGGAEDVRRPASLADCEGLDLYQLAWGIAHALVAAAARAPPRWSDEAPFENWSDQPHWCSWQIDRTCVDYVLDRYERPLVLGKRSSAGYLRRAAEDRGVPLVFRSDLAVPDGDFDVVLMTGSWGRPVTDKPIYQIMSAGWGTGEPVNVTPEIAAAWPPSRRA